MSWIKAWNIIAVIITIFAIFTWIAYFSSPYASHSLSNIGSNLRSIGSKLSSGAKSSVSEVTGKISGCNELARELVPGTITLTDASYVRYKEGVWIPIKENHWIDGSKMVSDMYYQYITYRAGSGEGQNINYFYREIFVVGDDEHHFTYSKKIVDTSGVILGTRTFIIDPILKPLPETKRQKYEGGRSTQQFEIIEPNIKNCDWVTD